VKPTRREALAWIDTFERTYPGLEVKGSTPSSTFNRIGMLQAGGSNIGSVTPHFGCMMEQLPEVLALAKEGINALDRLDAAAETIAFLETELRDHRIAKLPAMPETWALDLSALSTKEK
jgi:hypothetical protein